MGKIGCSLNGNLNEEKFSEPLPWIGIYMAVASLLCAVVMAADVIHGFRHRKLWFPSKFFCINATSLTIITVAIKFSVDLNTAMPRRTDQLSKLSSSVLICTIMGNSMPSIGAMENQEILTNIMALGILVITVIVNICIQLGTGVIYLYWKEHAVIMFLMLVLLLILSFSALTVPTNKSYLELKYKIKHEMAMKECSNESQKSTDEKLREDLTKYWMMAHTSSPQFVVARSVTCTAAGALCLLAAMTLAEAMLRSYFMPWSFKFCAGESDYKWSTILVLTAQTIGIVVGTIAPAIRWFTAVHFRCPTLGKKRCKTEFILEKYWIQFLAETKECPFSLHIQNQHCRKLIYQARNKILDLCIGMQTGIVLGSKVIRFISVYIIGRILLFCNWSSKLKFKSSNILADQKSESPSSSKPDLSRFVLHLEGENELVRLMMKNNRDATEHWIRKGRKRQPKHLIQLLEKSSSGLKGVREFDSYLVHSLDSEEPTNCWALPVVTLTAIATALPGINNFMRKQLMCSVHEGLTYVRLVEDNLDTEHNMSNIKRAGCTVWLGVDIYHKWLDVDLHKLSLQAESSKEILEGLADAAKKRYIELEKTCLNKHLLKKIPSKWPIKAVAANSMYRISQTILQSYAKSSSHDNDNERLFETLTVMISDILCACFTNLQRLILNNCWSSSVEEREECVRHAVFLLGETEKILEILQRKELPSLSPDEMVCIEEWRALQKQNHLSFPLSSQESDATSSISPDLHLTID